MSSSTPFSRQGGVFQFQGARMPATTPTEQITIALTQLRDARTLGQAIRIEVATRLLDNLIEHIAARGHSLWSTRRWTSG